MDVSGWTCVDCADPSGIPDRGDGVDHSLTVLVERGVVTVSLEGTEILDHTFSTWNPGDLLMGWTGATGSHDALQIVFDVYIGCP